MAKALIGEHGYFTNKQIRRSEDKTKYNAIFCIYLVQKIELVHVFARYLAI